MPDQSMKPLCEAGLVPGVERLLKDNDLYRKITALPIFTPRQFYFVWSRSDAAEALQSNVG